MSDLTADDYMNIGSLSDEERMKLAASMKTPIRCGGLDYCSKCNKPILRGQPKRPGDCDCE